MASDRIQRQIDRLLDEAEQASSARDWALVQERCEHVLTFDPDNRDAIALLAASKRGLERGTAGNNATDKPSQSPTRSAPAPSVPASFADGRYVTVRFLGEGGKKRVYLAHDTLLDRDVALALIKTEGLDASGRDRIRREAQAMGRLGSHPHVVSVFDLGEESNGQPFIVTELMDGGDVEGLIEKAPEHRPPLDRSLEIGIQVCRGLELAHRHGIVHRDLKPGNVWLAADGTAKLGDFGLAVALDRSRLTQAGMMVGTVSYMPPEQAMGGEVTPQSDLYSLGAMLYELVTGRPPFVGDESVAIITQHLNTPPVAPSWHRPDCPPGLEALILRLLEKDPSKRPASAGEVREALANISSHPSISLPLPEQEREQTAENPLYRRTFVGRESELRQLSDAFDRATSGQGSLAMVAGEPGIGKTSVCEQLATYAAIRGGRTLVGHCYEEGSLSLPYLPFVEAMRSYVLVREPEGLKQDLGSGAGEVARVVSEVRDRVGIVENSAGADAEEQRWRLLQAVSSFLRNASLVQPLLIILEDLHDADRGTLDLLVHLARNLQGARLLVIGTYRDVEVDRGHPLSSALAELRRAANFLRVPLRGLTVDEVHRMMTLLGGEGAPWSRAEAIHRQTEGNPLFVQEVLRYLAEEGLAAREGGRDARRPDDSADAAIPDGLRDVLGKRLSRLSDKTNQVLAVAAVIGREFRLDVLQRVLTLPEEEVTSALEEASATAVIETRAGAGPGVAFRFTHALFRQTLYEELFSLRRIRLHQQVARALEAVYERRLDEHAAELAEHFAQSTEHEDMDKALHYSELAAQRALAVYAYGEAARHLEQALAVLEVLNPDDTAKRCDLMLALAEALASEGETTRAVAEVTPEALQLAETLGDRRRASRACRIVQRTLVGSIVFMGSAEAQRWAQLGDRYADDGTLDRVYADLFLCNALAGRGDSERALSHLRRALQLAQRLGDPLALMTSSRLLLNGLALPPEAEDERIGLADELAKSSLEGIDSAGLAEMLLNLGWVYLTWGRREEAERHWQRAKEASLHSRDAATAFIPHQIDALVRTLDGDLLRLPEIGAQILARGADIDRQLESKRISVRAMRRALIYLGRADEALAEIPGPPELFLGDGALWAQRALCLAHMGRVDEAWDILERMLTARDMSRVDDPTQTAVLRVLLEAAVVARDANMARALETRMAPLAGLLHTVADMCYCIGRLCGGAAALLGEQEKARAYYEQAIEVCTKVRFRPELALTRLELAELMLGEGVGSWVSGVAPATDPQAAPAVGARLIAPVPSDAQRTEALQHLDFAIAEFRDMKMQPALERALRHKDVLKA